MDEYKNDIEKYLRGELTPAEMHALEMKALHDPFLADALEGAQQLNPAEFSADLNELESQITQRVRKKRIGEWGWLMRIAAALLLLAVSTYLIVLLSGQNETTSTESLALNKKPEASAAPKSEGVADSAIATPTPPAALPLEKEEAKPKASSGSGPIASQQQDEQSRPLLAPIAEPAPPPKDQEASADDLKHSNETEKRLENETKQIAVETDKNESTPEKLSKAESKKESRGRVANSESQVPSYSHNVARKIIRGKVTFSEDGAGLPGVNVLIKDSNEGTVTDAEGNYELAVNDNQNNLLFSFIGFTNKEVEVTSEEVNVQLDADVSELSEVVVVGYAPRDQVKLPLDPDIVELATPEGGRKAFKQYLEKNLHYPEQALENKVEGKVTIQFSIGTSGQLSDFKVIRGIGYGCDEEVIRLIKAGPKWSPTKRNSEVLKDRVRVRMRFALPDK